MYNLHLSSLNVSFVSASYSRYVNLRFGLGASLLFIHFNICLAYNLKLSICMHLIFHIINNWLVDWATDSRSFCYKRTTPSTYLCGSFLQSNELPIDLNNKQADALNPFDFIKRMSPLLPVGNITRVRRTIHL